MPASLITHYHLVIMLRFTRGGEGVSRARRVEEEAGWGGVVQYILMSDNERVIEKEEFSFYNSISFFHSLDIVKNSLKYVDAGYFLGHCCFVVTNGL